ncbi:hypothetical protein JBL43_00765 [Aureibaculum sp. A20]|uniref:MORN repeat variant n=1 Tax=Aureibaculum flavum TaxID=2795986 RepID=A0ABS0WL98_9FLAO|nr:hypothetical protein [Aureibaculum flavum]MBJ2172747.1 hypothetical protein [Aureibaculum flavum]
MRIKLVITIFFVVNLNVYSQHSKKFIELTKTIKPIDSIIKTKNYSNGKTKKVSKFLVYEYGEYSYNILSGNQQIFNKTGELFFEQSYDNFGNLLYQKQFNKSGDVYKIIETSRIDLMDNITIEQILNSSKDISIESVEREFNQSEKEGKLKLWKEGKRLNGKKIGQWKTYNLCDNTFKIKNY